MILTLIFWASVILLAHSYLFYPVIIQLIARKKSLTTDIYKPEDELPFVSIVMSVHNEEKVMAEKIKSIFHSNYPLNKLELIIGSDNSMDGTNRICEIYEKNYKNLIFISFTERRGKPAVINELIAKSRGTICIITDANVFFHEDTVFNLVKYFKAQDVGLVDTIMTHSGLSSNGIAIQEHAYINREVKIKQYESRIWGAMMGPFGGCYAIQKKLFKEIPPNHLVDDFFINMSIVDQGKKAINSPDALVVEDVSHNLVDEFRRKIRIATGNFQNLRYFSHILIKFWKGEAFAFLSHKVLRWVGPFLMIAAFISNLFLLDKPIYQITFVVQILLVFLTLIDLIFNSIKVKFTLFRIITHFFSMNLAMLIGFFKAVKGVKTGIWQPTRRYQGE